MKASYKGRKVGLMIGLYDVIMSIRSFFRRNLNNFANVMIGVCPFLFLVIGELSYAKRGYLAMGGEMLALAPFWVILIAVLKKCSKRQNVVDGMPVPSERFTEVNGDEVNVKYDRVNDLLLYVADLEDWLEREGYSGYDEQEVLREASADE